MRKFSKEMKEKFNRRNHEKNVKTDEEYVNFSIKLKRREHLGGKDGHMWGKACLDRNFYA